MRFAPHTDSDVQEMLEQHGGFVFAMGIDKYMYVVLNIPYADRLVRLHYTRAEMVPTVKSSAVFPGVPLSSVTTTLLSATLPVLVML